VETPLKRALIGRAGLTLTLAALLHASRDMPWHSS